MLLGRTFVFKFIKDLFLKKTIIKNLLWVDCIGALLAGIIVLILSQYLAIVYNLPIFLVIFIGLINILYGSFSFSLARKNQRSSYLIKLLSVGNLTWALFMVSVGTYSLNSSSIFGLIHIFGEGIYVGILGYIEWKNRSILMGFY